MTMTSTRIMDGLKSCIRDRFMEKQTLCRVALTAGLIVTSSMCMPRYSTAAETRAANPYQEGMDLMRAGNYDIFTQVQPKYEDPYPLSDKYFLCSRMVGRGEEKAGPCDPAFVQSHLVTCRL